jgi:hypothetical protein
VGWVAPEQRYWIIEPLIDAGLELDQIRDLLFRISFDAIVNEGRCLVASVTELVGDQPAEIQAAWTTTVGRMLDMHPLGE